MMLHIGCGNERIEEFVNVDCRRTEATDIVTIGWRLDSIGAASVDYVYARHVLEHMHRADAERAIREWRRVLRPGGLLHLVVPNIEFHARQLLGLVACPQAQDQADHALAGFYGWQNPEHGGSEIDTHKWGYTPSSLQAALVAAGFTPTDDGFDQLTSRDVEPWHINMRAKRGLNG